MIPLSPKDEAAYEATEARNADIIERVLEGIHAEEPEARTEVLRYVLALEPEELIVHVPQLPDSTRAAALTDISLYEALTLRLMLKLGVLLTSDGEAPWHEQGFLHLSEGLRWLNETALARASDPAQPEEVRWLNLRVAEAVRDYELVASALVGWRVVPQGPLEPGVLLDLVAAHHAHLVGMRVLLLYSHAELQSSPASRRLFERYCQAIQQAPPQARA